MGLFLKKIEVHLAGGLGNQIFQYSAGRRLSERLNRDLVINTTRVARSHSAFDLSSFDLKVKFKKNLVLFLLGRKIPTANKLRDKWFSTNKRHLVDKSLEENFTISDMMRINSISGYFQDLRYLRMSDLAYLKLRNASDGYKSHKLFFSKRSVIGVHIRRGDFLGQIESHGCLSAEWYLNQIVKLREFAGHNAVVVIFTDDRSWVFEKIFPNIPTGLEVFVISNKDLVDPAESWDLFRSANYLICSNSTFSITAAFFSNSQVVTPLPLTRKVGFEAIESSLPLAWTRAAAIWET